MNTKLLSLEYNKLLKLVKVILILLCQLIYSKCSNLSTNYNYDVPHNRSHKHSNSNFSKFQEEQPYILADRETLLMRGYSTSFTDGYMDGCQTGQHNAGDSYSNYVKNEEHAKINKDYLIGWQQGSSFCYEHMRNLIRNSGSNDPNIYRSKKSIESEKQRMWSELKK